MPASGALDEVLAANKAFLKVRTGLKAPSSSRNAPNQQQSTSPWAAGGWMAGGARRRHGGEAPAVHLAGTCCLLSSLLRHLGLNPNPAQSGEHTPSMGRGVSRKLVVVTCMDSR